MGIAGRETDMIHTSVSLLVTLRPEASGGRAQSIAIRDTLALAICVYRFILVDAINRYCDRIAVGISHSEHGYVHELVVRRR